MSLQFIFGNSGSGKSTWLYQQVLAEAACNPEKNYLIIVPEQFTMQTQRELVRLQGAHAIMNVDVLSFARLAYRVFDELGKENLMVLEETGKNLILRKVAEAERSKLKVLGSNIHKMGYVGEVKSFLSELAQYNITPEALQEFLLCNKLSDSLQRKLEDILVLYRGFREFLEGRFITAEEILGLLGEILDESSIIRDSVIVFDEFTGFTPVQNKLIERLLRVSEQIRVALTIDVREDFYHCQGVQELFAMSKKTVASLLKMADFWHVEIKDPIMIPAGKRYEHTPQLHFMEQNLFRAGSGSYQGEVDAIEMSVHKNPKCELKYVAAQIAKLVREKNYRYKDIAVVTGDVNLYANYVAEVFGKYEIPYFVDQTKTILFHPLVEFIRAALEMIESNFSYESVFRFLRCDLCGYDMAQVDIVENYVLAKGIRGRKKWQSEWKSPGDVETDEIQELNRFREELMMHLLPFYQTLSKKELQVEEATIALYQLLGGYEVEQQLKKKEEAYTSLGDFTKAKEYAQIYRIVMELFDKVVALLGNECISISEYSDILDAGFDAAKVATIPPGNDKVMLGDIERTRLNHIKILFFVGVNDGVIPKAESAGGIITQFEREMLGEFQMELAPGARERVFIQKFYLYLNMTKPSDKLYITFSKVNAEGKALRRSYLTGTLLKLFPGMTIKEEPEEIPSEWILTPLSGMEYFLQGLQEKEPSAIWLALTNWYQSNPVFKEKVDKLLEASCTYYQEEPISRAVTKALYGNVLENSVTRLERFAACAFAHYLQYGLNLKERELLQFASVDMGNIYHKALECFAKEVKAAGFSWSSLDDIQTEQFIEAAMEETIQSFTNTLALEDAKNQYLLQRMKRTLHCAVWAMVRQVKCGQFEPSAFEVAFSGVSELDAIRFELSDEEKMRLKGRIDRIDTYETDDKVYVRIIDYKSGNTTFSLLNLYHGLQLQLVVYMNAALEVVEKKHKGKQVEPAGIFYYQVKHPMIDAEGSESEDALRDAIFEELKLNGLVNKEKDVYRAMDKEFTGNSKVIPVGEKTDGSLKASSKVVSETEFAALGAFVNDKIAETGKKIFAGDVSVNPYQMEKQTGCDYCPYHAVCGFDTKLSGYHFRKLDTVGDSASILEKMKEKSQTKQGDVKEE